MLPAFVEPFEQPHDFEAGLRIEVAGGLVRQENRRVVHERARDGHALPLTARQFVGTMGHAIDELHFRERSLRSLQTVLGRHAGVDERQLDVVQRRGSRQQVERLEDEPDLLVADAGQFVVVHLAGLLAVQQIRTLGRGVEAADEIHQR